MKKGSMDPKCPSCGGTLTIVRNYGTYKCMRRSCKGFGVLMTRMYGKFCRK